MRNSSNVISLMPADIEPCLVRTQETHDALVGYMESFFEQPSDRVVIAIGRQTIEATHVVQDTINTIEELPYKATRRNYAMCTYLYELDTQRHVRLRSAAQGSRRLAGDPPIHLVASTIENRYHPDRRNTTQPDRMYCLFLASLQMDINSIPELNHRLTRLGYKNLHVTGA